MRRIEFRNMTGMEAEVEWHLNEDQLVDNPFFISSNTKLKFLVPPNNQHPIKMSFGTGVWSPAEIKKLVSFLDELEIKSASKKIKLKEPAEIAEFLLANRQGQRSKIKITISE